ncbi:MAG: NAD-dependent epimerase/dehydratase family protein [Pleurocapsa sp. MO_226.B13]|nr:NAD-dependent epimerase/dehydratase family protein [Pleurocapsa sp. MO_226.B13]
MNKILVTGAEGFLGYHTIKLLNERQIKPRGLVDVEDEQLVQLGLKNLEVEIVKGSIQDLQVLRQACKGIDTVFHMKFEIALGGGKAAEEKMQQINVVGTRNLLQAATEAGVKRVVISSSCLAVGLNHKPEPINETADWDKYQFNLPYALSRRQAELESLAVEARDDNPEIVAIEPSFTMGSEDYIGAPANQLAKLISQGKFKFDIPLGFGILDVRDYAAGALLAAEKGRHGQRYLLSGENVTLRQFINQVATIAGVKPPKFLIPLPVWVVYPIVAVIQLLSRIRGQPSPVNPSILELWNRYAFYDTSLAQKELGWKARSLEETISDSLQWIAQR